MSQPFEMPPVYLGQIVRWKTQPGSDVSAPAMVVAIGTHNVGLLVYHQKTVNGFPYDGVLHEKDPKFDVTRFADQGVWAYTEDQDDYLNYLVSKEA